MKRKQTYRHTKEAIEKIRAASTGRRHSKDVCEKISKARKLYCNTPEFIKKARERFTMENSPMWKGGRTSDGGYILVRCEGHPYARENGKYVFEHRLVMEKNIGRYLEPNEIVHHINENKNDNRIENLELMTRSDHMKLHEPTLRGTIITCRECGKKKTMDSVKFHCCRYCYLNNHLGYRKFHCVVHKRNHACRFTKDLHQKTSTVKATVAVLTFK